MLCKNGKFAKSISRRRKTTCWKVALTAARYSLATDRRSCDVVKVRPSGPRLLLHSKEPRAGSSCFPWEVTAHRSLMLISPSALLLMEVLENKALVTPAEPWAPGHLLAAAWSNPAETQLLPEPNSAVELGPVYLQQALEMNKAALQQVQNSVCLSWLSLRGIKLVWQNRQEANPNGEKHHSSTLMPSLILAWDELILKPCLLIWIFTDSQKSVPLLSQGMSEICLANKKKKNKNNYC